MRRALDLLTIAAFVVVLSVPAIAWVCGVEGGENLENRRLSKRPALTLAALLDPAVGTGWSNWFRDRMPLRGPLLRADHELDYSLFRDSPSLELIRGHGDWLFLTDSIYGWEVDEAAEPADDVRRIEAIITALRASGRRVLFTLSPNKASIYPEYLRPRECELARRYSGRRREAIRERFRHERGFLDLWAIMLERKDELARRPVDDQARAPLRFLFRPGDRHAGQEYARIQARAIVRRLWPDFTGPGLPLSEKVITDRAELAWRFGKLDRSEPYYAKPVFKPSKVDRISRVQARNWYRARRYGDRRRPIVRAKVVVIGDSFMDYTTPYLAHDIRETLFISWLAASGRRVAETRELLEQFDTVVIQMVEDRSWMWLPDAMELFEGLPEPR